MTNQTCHECKGSGVVGVLSMTKDRIFSENRPCPSCSPDGTFGRRIAVLTAFTDPPKQDAPICIQCGARMGENGLLPCDH